MGSGVSSTRCFAGQGQKEPTSTFLRFIRRYLLRGTTPFPHSSLCRREAPTSSKELPRPAVDGMTSSSALWIKPVSTDFRYGAPKPSSENLELRLLFVHH